MATEARAGPSGTCRPWSDVVGAARSARLRPARAAGHGGTLGHPSPDHARCRPLCCPADRPRRAGAPLGDAPPTGRAGDVESGAADRPAVAVAAATVAAFRVGVKSARYRLVRAYEQAPHDPTRAESCLALPCSPVGWSRIAERIARHLPTQAHRRGHRNPDALAPPVPKACGS